MKIAKLMQKVITSLTVISMALLIAFAASCRQESKTITKEKFPSQVAVAEPDTSIIDTSEEFTYRGAVSEKTYLHQMDVDYIAEKLSESRKTESWWMGIISGTLLLLVGAQLAFNKNSTSAIAMMTNRQCTTDQKVTDLEKAVDRHEEIISGTHTKSTRRHQ